MKWTSMLGDDNKTADRKNEKEMKTFTKMGNHTLLGRSDIVGAKIDDTKYISKFILNASP